MGTQLDKRLNKLLGQVFQRPADERKAFVVKACGEDRRLLEKALEYLDHEDEVGDFLELPIIEALSGDTTTSTAWRRKATTVSPSPDKELPYPPREDWIEVPLDSLIGPYRILDRLGKGGMGMVYRAEDTRLERIVALKFLPLEFNDHVEVKTRFLREAKTASKLDHPNVCTVHEIGETEDGRLYIVMACYEGENLKERLKRGSLDVDQAVRIFRQVAAALAKAHRAGIVHRDIKPANVFLTVGDDPFPDLVKVLDFGIAKMAGDQALTEAGKFVGTPSYMAPEQIRGQADKRSDVWALGVLLYEMLTGEKPFSGAQAFIDILHKSTPRLKQHRPGLPAYLYQIVDRALCKKPEERYPTVEAMVAELPVSPTDSATVMAEIVEQARREAMETATEDDPAWPNIRKLLQRWGGKSEGS